MAEPISCENDKQQEYDIKLTLEAIRKAADIRLDKINLSRERLKNSFYFSREVTQKIADKILEEKYLLLVVFNSLTSRKNLKERR